jgi:L-rhamnose-H+ transport protein
MAFSFAAGKPIAEAAVRSGAQPLFQNFPVMIVALLGGFTTNFLWCATLSIRNRTGRDYLRVQASKSAGIVSGPASGPATSPSQGAMSAASAGASDPSAHSSAHSPAPRPAPESTPSLVVNYLFSALAGITWYFQFFFYGMGTTKMGKYDFSSWTIHMAFIITFSSLWGIYFHEWKGTGRPTRRLVVAGILVLILSTIVVGAGNYVATLK